VCYLLHGRTVLGALVSGATLTCTVVFYTSHRGCPLALDVVRRVGWRLLEDSGTGTPWQQRVAGRMLPALLRALALIPELVLSREQLAEVSPLLRHLLL
jgi:hypothetical protein